MRLVSIIFWNVILILVFGCTKEVTGPTEEIFPEKLYPYETTYDADDYKLRRNNLMAEFPDENGIAVVTTNDTYPRNGDVGYEFRPSSTFYYLTGFDEPSAAALIRKNRSSGETELIMFVEERSEIMQHWLGPVYGVNGAVEIFQADSAFVISQFEDFLDNIFISEPYLNVYGNLEENAELKDIFTRSAPSTINVHDLINIVNDLRVIKSAVEIEAIKKAVEVTVQAFTAMIESIEPGIFEYELEAIMDYIIGTNGCPRPAFPAIVASGSNSNILHYQANNRLMQDGDLVMVDYGAEYAYYASDVSRTLPVNGEFSNEQKTIYNIVLDAHRTVLEAAAPGVNYYDLYALSRNIILDGLIENGVISGNRETIIADGSFRQYIPAGLGHSVGLDVHDPFPLDFRNQKILHKNMIMAFEPHIYLSAGDNSVNSSYWNVNVRIEDTVLITEDGNEILSSGLPVSPSDIESMID